MTEQLFEMSQIQFTIIDLLMVWVFIKGSHLSRDHTKNRIMWKLKSWSKLKTWVLFPSNGTKSLTTPLVEATGKNSFFSKWSCFFQYLRSVFRIMQRHLTKIVYILSVALMVHPIRMSSHNIKMVHGSI